MTELAAGESWRTLGLALLFGCFFLVAVWELYWPRCKLESGVAPRWLGNLTLYGINGALVAWAFPGPSDAVAHIETSFGIAPPRWPELPFVLNIALGFLFLDCLRYWLHRLFHAVPWLWRLHSLHHADSNLDVSTSYRHHPIEFFAGSALFWVVFVLSGFPASVAAGYFFCASLLAFFQHGNIRLPPSWEPVLQKIVVTPDMHRLHHSVALDEANSNFGFLFSFWDRLFATHRQISPAAHEKVQFGLTEFRNPSFSMMLLLPFRLGSAVARAE